MSQPLEGREPKVIHHAWSLLLLLLPGRRQYLITSCKKGLLFDIDKVTRHETSPREWFGRLAPASRRFIEDPLVQQDGDILTRNPHTLSTVTFNWSAMGWTYNTDDNVANNGPHITAVAIVLTSASLGTLLLRLHVRVWMIKAIGAGTWRECGYAFNLLRNGRR
jgi:hypothetical protein